MFNFLLRGQLESSYLQLIISSSLHSNYYHAMRFFGNFIFCHNVLWKSSLILASPSLTILVPLWFILISLEVFYLKFVNYYFQVSFNLKVILLMIKITQNAVTLLL